MDHHLQQYEVHTFVDFVTPNYNATIPILGKRGALDALNRTLCAGYYAQTMSLDNEHPAYDPLVVALNTICADKNMPLITTSDLYTLQFRRGLTSFAKNFIKANHAQDLINLDNLFNPQGTFTEDDMALMTAAFAASSGCGNIGLGVVTLVNGQSVRAFHYPDPDTSPPPDYTAWIIADFRAGDAAFYGVGRKVVQQHHSVVEQEEGRGDTIDDAMEDDGDDADDENNQVPSTTPRKTATRVLQQQIPLPANLTAEDILHHHKSRLQYNNILKVALLFSNKEIADQCKSDLLPKDQRLCHASAVVKRINTAINWIEDQFEIDTDAFRTAFDQERRNKDIPARGKDEVSDEVLALNSSKIDAAMSWVKSGGPRPTQDVDPAPYPSSVNTTSATDPVLPNPVSGASDLGHRPHGTIPTGYIPAPIVPASVQASFAAPDPDYGHHSQTGVGSGGDIGSGMMPNDNGSHFTNGHDANGTFMTGLNRETGMEGDIDWSPRDFGFEDSFLKFE
ncbi:hypothetical protein KCU62_g995, partial [Aureobasidium sp. EXF-3399]